jgi:hypothetical protein
MGFAWYRRAGVGGARVAISDGVAKAERASTPGATQTMLKRASSLRAGHARTQPRSVNREERQDGEKNQRGQ